VALASRPELLFLDEPTAGLGSDGRDRLAELVRRLKGQVTIVVIEHDMEFLFGLADDISVIHWGQVIAHGSAGRAARQSLGEELQPRKARLMLEVRAIDTYYGETQALFDVSFDCRHGRGAGPARRQRCGQDHGVALDPRPHAARARAISCFDGQSLKARETHEIARAGIGWVPDDRRICFRPSPSPRTCRSASSARATAPGRYRRSQRSSRRSST
jgi:ABC-type branched-subunit amino acid transport system ATPase component